MGTGFHGGALHCARRARKARRRRGVRREPGIAFDDTPERRAEARRRFVAPLRAHLEEAGLGHVSEIADAEPPFTPRGCPFQAWSVGELLRVERLVAAPVTVAR